MGIFFTMLDRKTITTSTCVPVDCPVKFFYGPYMHIYTNAVILCFSHRSPGCCRLFSTGIRLAFQALQGIIKHLGPGPQGLPLNSTRQEEDALLESVDTGNQIALFLHLFVSAITQKHTLTHTKSLLSDYSRSCHMSHPPTTRWASNGPHVDP